MLQTNFYYIKKNMLIPRGLESFLQRNLNREKMYRKKFRNENKNFLFVTDYTH